MEVFLQDYTGVSAHATKLYGDFFSLLDHQTARGRATNQPDDGDKRLLLLLFFFKPKTDLFKYYYSLIALSHSLRLRPLLLQTHTTRSSFLSPRSENFPYNEGNFYHQHCWQHC